MTKKDYIKIASVFANCRASTHEETGMKDCLMERMADELARGVPTFDKQRFLAVCRKD